MGISQAADETQAFCCKAQEAEGRGDRAKKCQKEGLQSTAGASRITTLFAETPETAGGS
jgi:hypothetical protein